jgi:hypothetical protein
VLRATVAAIADQAARERAQAWLARLDTARDAVSAAAGDPDELAVALGLLDAEFTSITGACAERRHGQMYAGRRICYEETIRDVEVTFGGPVLEAMAGPFGGVLLPAARWLSGAVAGAYTRAGPARQGFRCTGSGRRPCPCSPIQGQLSVVSPPSSPRAGPPCSAWTGCRQGLTG